MWVRFDVFILLHGLALRLLFFHGVNPIAVLAGMQKQVMRTSRRLLDLDDTPLPADVQTVSTTSELIEAIGNGRLDILITEHLDFTGLPLFDVGICDDGCGNPVGKINVTRSIRGNCSTLPDPAILENAAPEGVSLLDVQLGQCLLLGEDDFLTIFSPRVWIDNLYLRTAYTGTVLHTVREAAFPVLAPIPALDDELTGSALRYFTRVTFQGDGLGPVAGIFADERTYIENCTFSSLGGDGSVTGGIPGCADCNAAVIARTTYTHIVDSMFSAATGTNTSHFVSAINSGEVLLTGSSYADAPRRPFFVDRSSTFYSDDPDLNLITDNFNNIAPRRPEDVPAYSSFPRRDDVWFASLRNILTGEELNLPESGGGGGNGVNVGGLVGGLVAAFVAVLVTVTVAMVVARDKKRRRGLGDTENTAMLPVSGDVCGPAGAATPGSERDSVRQTLGSTTKARSLVSTDSMAHSATVSTGQSGPGGGASSGTALRLARTNDSFTVTAGTTEPITPPQPGAPVGRKLEYLHAQLDGLGKDTVVLDRFRLLGSAERRQGGQGVVAFARGVSDNLEYAIKFFVIPASFRAERDLYNATALFKLFPKLEVIYDKEEEPTRLLDCFGQPLPSCMVMERGESLNEWSRRAKPDIFQSIAVLAHVGTRLRDMHEAGYVHRDIKPGNVMLLPRENRWTVIDFGCTAEIHSEAPMAYTITYAAPETIADSEAGKTTTKAEPAVDAWALGVLAYELLTGGAALNLAVSGRQAIKEQLLGQNPLPWEGDQLTSAVKKKLGIFREPILALLNRDATERLSVQGFCDACNEMFSSTTTENFTG